MRINREVLYIEAPSPPPLKMIMGLSRLYLDPLHSLIQIQTVSYNATTYPNGITRLSVPIITTISLLMPNHPRPSKTMIEPMSHHRLKKHSFVSQDDHTGFDRFKRCLDVFGSLVGLVLFTPVLALSAVWIFVLDGRPVFYRQWRVGHKGWLFRLYKLRTMTTDAEGDGQARFASGGDPRILSGCAWMRKSHVDEIPQMWNILKGEMSLVGPRPERPEIIERLRRSMPKIERRLVVKPGLTGLAQIRNGYTFNTTGARKKLAHDLRYLRRRSVWSELRLLLATIPKVWDQSAM